MNNNTHFLGLRREPDESAPVYLCDYCGDERREDWCYELEKGRCCPDCVEDFKVYVDV